MLAGPMAQTRIQFWLVEDAKASSDRMAHQCNGPVYKQSIYNNKKNTFFEEKKNTLWNVFFELTFFLCGRS